MRWRTWSLPRLARSAGVCEGTNSVSRPCLPRPWIAVRASRRPWPSGRRRAGEDRTELIYVRRLEDSRWPLLHLRGEARFRYLDGHGQWHRTGRRARNWPIPFPRRWHWRLPRSACLSLSRSHCPERGPPNMISDGARRHAASARSSGFVLVGVVWFLAIMTLLASAAVLWVGRSLDATENRRKVLLRELEEHALLARVQWLVATQRYTVAGLSVPGNAGAAPSKVDMDTSILPIGGSCLWMAGSSAWPMAGALRCSIALRASVFPASIRGYCPGCWRGWGFPPSRCRSWSPNGSAISIPAPLHDWVVPRKPATGPLRARPGAVRCAR